MRTSPIACLSPFNYGRHKLPNHNDKARIKSRTAQAHITSGATRRPDMDATQLKRLGDICKNLSKVNAGFGAVRFRKRFNDITWRTELFGQAQSL